MYSLSWDTRPLERSGIDWIDFAPGYELGGQYDEKGWQEVGDYLFAQGLSKYEVKAILLSKHMRWSGDTLEHEPTGNVDTSVTRAERHEGCHWHYLSLSDFREYYDATARKINEDARRWAPEYEDD